MNEKLPYMRIRPNGGNNWSVSVVCVDEEGDTVEGYIGSFDCDLKNDSELISEARGEFGYEQLPAIVDV